MPLFMDVHEMLPDGAGFNDVAEAHAADVKTQGPYGVDYKSYWVDETQGKVFCLVEAPDADTAIVVHKETHGLVADRIFEVREGV
jgi:Nickel responsive protein SCO4226-like